jgi:hypothetical protein
MFAAMQSLRTPDERFAELPEFPYPAKYASWTTVTAANCGWRGWKTVPPKEIRC